LNFACGFAARKNSLAGVAREEVSVFAAKSFARAPTPASYAGGSVEHVQVSKAQMDYSLVILVEYRYLVF